MDAFVIEAGPASGSVAIVVGQRAVGWTMPPPPSLPVPEGKNPFGTNRQSRRALAAQQRRQTKIHRVGD